MMMMMMMIRYDTKEGFNVDWKVECMISLMQHK